MLTYSNGGRLVQDISELSNPPTVIERLYLDVETTSKNPKKDALNPWRNCWVAGIAVTWDDMPGAYYVPIAHAATVWNLPRDKVIAWLKKVMRAAKVWVNHNVKYDAHAIANDLGITFTNEHVCTVVRSKILDSDRQFRGGYGLDAVSRDWLHEDIGHFEQALKNQLGKSKDYGVVAADIMGDYACQDVISNRRLDRYLAANMPAESSPVVETETALTSLLIKMERRGLLVKPRELLVEKLFTLQRMVAVEQELHEEVGYAFLPTSNADCFDVLCNKYGLPVISYTEKDDGTRGNPSFDKETLEMYRARIDAPKKVVELMLEYRKLSTFNGLFLDTYSDLAIPVDSEYSLLHPNHNQCVRTGRMSVSDPNTQQLDKRAKRLIHPGHGHSFMSADACIPAGTLLPTPYGDKPIEIVANELLPVLTVTESGDLKFTALSRGGRVGFGPIYKITFDDGSSFECTGDHGLITYDGERINCKDLQFNQRLRHIKDTTFSAFGPGVYPAWRMHGRYYTKHRLSAEWAAGEQIDPSVYHVHHIDDDKTNWSVTNLEIKNRQDHLSEHAKANYESQDHELRVKRLRESLMLRRSYVGSGNPNWSGGKLVFACEHCGKPFEKWPSQQIRYCSARCKSNGRSKSLEKAWAERKAKLQKAHESDQNYKVINVEYVRDDWFFSITVPETGNYVTTNGLINLNSQIEFRTIAHYTQDPDIIKAYNDNPDVDYHQRVADMCGIKRRPAKTVNFSVAFGQGKKATVALLEVDEDVVSAIKDQIDELVNAGELALDGRDRAFKSLARRKGEALYDLYHETFPNIRAVSRAACNAALQRGYVRNIRGRRRYLPQEHAHKAFNTLNQSSAADIIKERMVAVSHELEGTGIELVTQVHDELVFVGPTEVLNDPKTTRDIIAILEDVQCLRVPVRFRYGVSNENWKEAAGQEKAVPLDEVKHAGRLMHLKETANA